MSYRVPVVFGFLGFCLVTSAVLPVLLPAVAAHSLILPLDNNQLAYNGCKPHALYTLSSFIDLFEPCAHLNLTLGPIINELCQYDNEVSSLETCCSSAEGCHGPFCPECGAAHTDASISLGHHLSDLHVDGTSTLRAQDSLAGLSAPTWSTANASPSSSSTSSISVSTSISGAGAQTATTTHTLRTGGVASVVFYSVNIRDDRDVKHKTASFQRLEAVFTASSQVILSLLT